MDVHLSSNQDQKDTPISSINTDILVGADGIHSNVRRCMLAQLGESPVEASHCGYAYFRAVVDVSKLSNNEHIHLGLTTQTTQNSLQEGNWFHHAFETWGETCRFGYVPLKPPYTFWFVAIPVSSNISTNINISNENQEYEEDYTAGLAPMQGSQRGSDRTKAWLLSQFGHWKGPVDIDALLKGTPASSILRTDIRKVKSVTNFPWSMPGGRVVLLGDAAHATAPNLAQG